MSFRGAAYFEPNEGYTQLEFDDFIEDKINVSIQTEELGCNGSALFYCKLYLKDKKSNIASQYLTNSQTPYLIRATSEFSQAPPGEKVNVSTELYIGQNYRRSYQPLPKGWI